MIFFAVLTILAFFFLMGVLALIAELLSPLVAVALFFIICLVVLTYDGSNSTT